MTSTAKYTYGLEIFRFILKTLFEKLEDNPEIKKTFKILISNKELIPKIYQEHLQFNTNKNSKIGKIFKQTLYKKRCANGQ